MFTRLRQILELARLDEKLKQPNGSSLNVYTNYHITISCVLWKYCIPRTNISVVLTKSILHWKHS